VSNYTGWIHYFEKIPNFKIIQLGQIHGLGNVIADFVDEVMYSAYTCFLGITDVVSVAIAAPPRDGEANQELIEYIASVLDLKKSQVSFDFVRYFVRECLQALCSSFRVHVRGPK
jgi:hypothetical protein